MCALPTAHIRRGSCVFGAPPTRALHEKLWQFFALVRGRCKQSKLIPFSAGSMRIRRLSEVPGTATRIKGRRRSRDGLAEESPYRLPPGVTSAQLAAEEAALRSDLAAHGSTAGHSGRRPSNVRHHSQVPRRSHHRR